MMTAELAFNEARKRLGEKLGQPIPSRGIDVMAAYLTYEKVFDRVNHEQQDFEARAVATAEYFLLKALAA